MQLLHKTCTVSVANDSLIIYVASFVIQDDKIASRRILCLLILSIWSWSLLQFTFVLTATKSRRTRITADIDPPKPKFVNGIYKVKEVCCSIDVWGILINIILQVQLSQYFEGF